MHITKRMEQFNLAYLCAMAAQAGMNPSKLDVDDDSVDLQLTATNWPGGRRRNPIIQLQLKCTAVAKVADDVIKFSLSKKNYDDLRAEDLTVPRYLVVMRVPETEHAWIQHNDDHMALHNSCYWASIRGYPPRENTTSVTVDIPLAQRLTTEGLCDLLSKASNGEAAWPNLGA
ncbi:DUF4365 domain-containing protein [Variovorax paradoxus]|nr:DUF4365 domain-containing protein [Variovorax paradoxus]